MDSILEQQRLLHEECERLELIIAKELINNAKTHKEKLKQEHRVNTYLEQIIEKTAFQLELYEDVKEFRSTEIEAILVSNDFGEFYKRLKDLKDYHRSIPDQVVDLVENDLKKVVKIKDDEDLSNMFTGEENFGRYLDLNEMYQMFINLKGINADGVEYLRYLDLVDNFDTIPNETRNSASYQRYLNTIVEYVRSFILRAHPLVNMAQLEQEAEQLFEERWAQVEQHKNHEDLYCIACHRTFEKKTVYDAHLSGKKHLKALEKFNTHENEPVTNGTSQDEEATVSERKVNTFLAKKRDNLRMEILAQKLLEAVAQEKMETKAALERKQTLTLEEYNNRLEDEQEEITEAHLQNNEIEDRFYNPLKLPMGWDGKPIPYWLFKLHGLGIEFPCEICGNFVYMGRKAFERHFQETRHANSMRNLGIPNTRQFHEITNIEDALDLWAKIQQEKIKEHDKAESMEEFEDAYGNVFNKKTYEDLKRQGLI